jgi:hypothetical protein
MSFLQGLSKATGQAITREDIMDPESFVRERARRAVVAVYAKRFDAGIRAAQESLVVKPDDLGALTRLGSAYYASGDHAHAREIYMQVLSQDPSNVKLREFVEKNLKQ